MAKKLFKLVPQNTGKKRFMARQLPFDIFINRKIQKWEARAQQKKIDFIDAIGVSPFEEMLYFWNGYKKMQSKHLEKSLQALEWSITRHPNWDDEDLDEKSIYHLLRATVLRNLGRSTEAKQVLQSEIISHDWSQFKGHLKDTWPSPCARYEMAASLWQERGEAKDTNDHLSQCSKYVEEVAKWESYDLDTRIGLKIATARETLRKMGVGATV